MYEEDFNDDFYDYGDFYGAVTDDGSLSQNVGKVYYRWKSANDHEWIEMTGREYFDFIKSEEGKKHFFIAEVDPNHETDTIVHEATQTEFRKWNSERTKYWQLEKDIRDAAFHMNAANCLKEKSHRRKKPVICNVISLDSEMAFGNDDDNFTLHELIADPDSFFEEALINNNLLHESLKVLEPEESAIIIAFFFNNPEELSERQISKEMGIPKSVFNDRKIAAIKKIRNFLKPPDKRGKCFASI